MVALRLRSGQAPAGVQDSAPAYGYASWIPICAGMTFSWFSTEIFLTEY
jgi:hypothetical protein